MTGVTHRLSKLWKQNTKTLRLEKKKRKWYKLSFLYLESKLRRYRKGTLGTNGLKSKHKLSISSGWKIRKTLKSALNVILLMNSTNFAWVNTPKINQNTLISKLSTRTKNIKLSKIDKLPIFFVFVIRKIEWYYKLQLHWQNHCVWLRWDFNAWFRNDERNFELVRQSFYKKGILAKSSEKGAF